MLVPKCFWASCERGNYVSSTAMAKPASWRFSLLLMLLSGCVTTAKGPTADVQIYSAPIDANVAAVRSIAVVPFERDTSEAFSRSVETALANVALTDKSQSRQNTVSVIGADRTRSLTRSLGDPAGLSSAAKRLGVDAILAGEIATASSKSEPYKEFKSVGQRRETGRFCGFASNLYAKCFN